MSLSVNEILAPPASSGPKIKGNDELGQEDFLKLLIAQLKNQDPANPADNGEFLSQIAQFSMVSGIDDLGASFEGMSDSLYTTQAIQAADLVGKNILADSNSLILNEGEAAEGVLTFDGLANGITVQIHDLSGNVVRTMDLGTSGAGSKSFIWDGADDSGAPMPAGEYLIAAQALVDGQLQALPVKVFTRVESVSVDRAGNGVNLRLAGSKDVDLSEVSEFK